jgi:hypothetical protein
MAPNPVRQHLPSLLAEEEEEAVRPEQVSSDSSEAEEQVCSEARFEEQVWSASEAAAVR